MIPGWLDPRRPAIATLCLLEVEEQNTAVLHCCTAMAPVNGILLLA